MRQRLASCAWVSLLGLVSACAEPAPRTERGEPQRSEASETRRASPEPTGGALPSASASAAPSERSTPSCEDRWADARAPLAAITEAHSVCRFDVDCVAAEVSAGCVADCPVALHPEGLFALRAAVAGLAEATCPELSAAGCDPERAACAEHTPRCAEGRCRMGDDPPPRLEVPTPAENALARVDDPPARPAADERTQERARRLFDAVVHDDPARAQDLFFPQEAFRQVKAMADPDGYWDRLVRRYAQDIHALHASLPDLARAEFDRLEVVRRGGWVRPREEGNRLPYWVARHNVLHYRVDGAARSFEVRVLITWGDTWYVTHLSEFR